MEGLKRWGMKLLSSKFIPLKLNLHGKRIPRRLPCASPEPVEGSQSKGLSEPSVYPANPELRG
jgi:hypothetical protein